MSDTCEKNSPLGRFVDLLPADVRAVVDRPSAIPLISGRAGKIRAGKPDFVRGDIGQILGVDPDAEIPYGAPAGLDELRTCVAETWNVAMGIDPPLAKENVACVNGAAEGISILLRCFAHGRNVGIPRGFWENYTNGVELGGGTSVMVNYFDASGRLDLDGLRREIDRHELAVLLANFPANPTGAVLDEGEARDLAEMVREAGILMIADEVYTRLRYDGQAANSLLAHGRGHVVVVYSASKEYLIPGARTGFVLSPEPDLTDRVVRKLVRASAGSPNVLGQRLALERLSADLADLKAGRAPSFVTRVRDTMRKRRDALLGVLERHGIETVGRAGTKPEGTIFLMAALPDWWKGDDEAFCERALELELFSAVPGSAFGLERCVRFSYGSLTDAQAATLDEALAVMRSAE